jgi:uncharacterized repeat protein (TIGR01451 family)
MSSGRTRYAYAKSGEQRIYFSPRWSRPVSPRRVSWILPAYARAVFLKKSFIIGLSLSLAFYPAAPAFVIADDAGATEEPAVESVEPEEPEEEEQEAEEPAEEPQEDPAEKISEEASVAEEVVPIGETVGSEPAPAPLETSTSEHPEVSPCDDSSGDGSADSATIVSCNEAEVKNDTEALSDTGENAIVVEEADDKGDEEEEKTEESADPDTTPNDGGTDSALDTGDAAAGAVSVNDVNTTIVGTDIAKELIEKDGKDDGDIDLLDAFFSPEEGDVMAAEEVLDPAGGGIEVVNGNEATLDNTVVASAETGENSIEGGGGAAIGTGEASALATAVNIVNTTLVGSNGLLAIVNIVGDYVGDIILPGEGLLSFGSGSGGSFKTVENENEATIENIVTAGADTGNNVIDGSGEATIVTGNAVAVAESETIANTNFVGDNWLLIVVNVFGQWLGGIVDGEDADGDGVIGFFFGGGGDGSCGTDCGDIASVTGKNVASIKNTVTATANTGGNSITGADDATIATGNASATAAAFNFVNNNVVGSNWLFGIVNVFGSWSGDLVFAYPDLATSVSDGRDTALPGDTLEYEVTVRNEGHADAADVTVSFRLPESAAYRSSTGDAEHGGDTVTWSIGSLKKGEIKGYSVKVSVGGDVSDGAELRAYAQTATGTAEKHPENNASDDTTRIDIPDARITDIDADDDPYHTGLRVKRSKPEGAYRGGDAITHWITVENTGENDAYDVVVKDSFESPDGTPIATPKWIVGTLDHGKGVRIEYTIAIPTQVGAGQYRYTARAEGRQRDDEEIKSKKAYAMLVVAGSAFASALGAETAEAAPVEAAPLPGEVRGAEAGVAESFVGKETFPLWMLLLSGVAYGLMLNWSFFPSTQRRTTNI